MFKSFNNKTIIVILIIIFLLTLNYENIVNLFTLREGKDDDTGKRTKEDINKEIKDLEDQILTADETGDETTELTLKDFLSNNKRKGLYKKMIPLFIELNLLQKKNDTFKEFSEEFLNEKKTYKINKDRMYWKIITTAYFGCELKALKDNGFDLISEMDNIGSTGSGGMFSDSNGDEDEKTSISMPSLI